MCYQYDKFLKYGFGNNIENLSVEIDLQKKLFFQWLLQSV